MHDFCSTALESEPAPSLLEALMGSLSSHPQLSDKICESIAQLAKQGVLQSSDVVTLCGMHAS